MRSRAAVLFEAPGRWEVREVEVDRPKEHEVLVRWVASGVCHSDVHCSTGDTRSIVLPICGGHEGAGIVEEVGSGVAGLSRGDHVVNSFLPSCGHCRYCASGHQNLCVNGAFLLRGPQLDGTYRMHCAGQDVSQYCLLGTFSAWSVLHENSLVKVPDDLPLDTVCLLACGVGTGFGTAVNGAKVEPGDVVIVMGVGGVGINAIQGAALAGAGTLIAVDPVPTKRQMAIKLGATHAFAHIDEAAEFARSITNGQGANSAVVTVGTATGEIVAQAVDAIGKGGTVAITSLPGGSEPAVIPISISSLVPYQKRIQGCLYGMCNPAAEILRGADLYRAGHLKLEELITSRYGIDDINVAVTDLLEGRNIRGVIMHEH